MGALFLCFFYPLQVSALVRITGKILVGCLAVTFLEAVALQVPLVAGDKSRIIERGCKSVHMPIEYVTIILADNPFLDRIWVFH